MPCWRTCCLPIFAKFGTYNVASDAPFKRIGYVESMERYGTDKPDLRIDLHVEDITALTRGTEFARSTPRTRSSRPSPSLTAS